MTLQAQLDAIAIGSKITIKSDELKRPRTVTVTGRADGTVCTSSGRVRSGNIGGGALWFDQHRGCIVFQATPLQTPVDVGSVIGAR